jgi:E3 ubiquitin-protein ligase DOA10
VCPLACIWGRPFPVNGQGVFIFNTEDKSPIFVSVENANGDNSLGLYIDQDKAYFIKYVDPDWQYRGIQHILFCVSCFVVLGLVANFSGLSFCIAPLVFCSIHLQYIPDIGTRLSYVRTYFLFSGLKYRYMSFLTLS